MTGQPSVATIICCYTERRLDQVVAAVRSVVDQSCPATEIVVVVDHNPALRDVLERRLADVSGLRLLTNVHDRGLTGARNTGVESTDAEIVAFLDDDAAENVVAVGGRVDAVWAGTRPGWFPDEFGWVVGCSYTGQPEHRAVVRNVIGANMSFRRKVIAQVGGFPSGLGRIGTLPLGCEETELCIRAARETGGVVIHQPAAIVGHHVSADRHTWRYFRSRCWSEGLSKAAVARLAGSAKALEAERAYTTDILPRGVLAAVRAGEVRRAGAILAGLTVTAAGYATGRLRRA